MGPTRTLRTVAILCLAAAPLSAASEPAPALAGLPSRVRIEAGDTLVDLAARELAPFDLVVRLNPGVKVWIPEPGTRVELPTRYIPLPAPTSGGLLVNVPEMRLYDYRESPPRPYAVAVGDAVDPTPIGAFAIGGRRVDPAWHVPASIRAKRPELPGVVRPGPENPLGSRWLGLRGTTYGIHGTNLPWSIGRMSTHGCIRLYEQDAQHLYARTPSGTPVTIVYEPVKVGLDHGEIYLEVHPDLYGRVGNLRELAEQRLAHHGLLGSIDPQRLEAVLAEMRGAPVSVGSLLRTANAAPPVD